MKHSLHALLRANPDLAALMVIVALLLPNLGATPNRFQLSLVSRPQTERVWQRLESKMRRFEQRFERLTPPRSRSASALCREGD